MTSCRTRGTTHEVFNQPVSLENYNLYEQDAALKEALLREGGAWAEDRVKAYGHLAGSELMPLGFAANENPPEFRSHDRFGHRIDSVLYHPAYHKLMDIAVTHGLHSLPWTVQKSGAHVARAAMMYCHGQAEAGTLCPVTMTFASVPAIESQPEAAEFWKPRITASTYDSRDMPADPKAGVTIGMAMTEKQGGSDVRANTTRACPTGAPGPGQPYELIGHKWFCSAPMSDAFLVLAQADPGLSCFLLPRWRPDGTRNAFHIQRLKNKLGNRSNASSEVEFNGAHALMIGPEGRGVATILRMVALTRFDCMVGSSALMRQAVSQALHHAAYRSAFGKKLTDQPLMQNVLADLAIESEAALVLTMRVGRALDQARTDGHERALTRILTAIGKYWICKRSPGLIYEAAECLGGGGYVEESILPRLYREAPVNAIWEGCGNIQALDLLRAAGREPGILDAFFAEVEAVKGENADLDRCVEKLRAGFSDLQAMEYRSRNLIEAMAQCFQGALLIRHAPGAVADGFCLSRLSGRHGLAYGTLPQGIDVNAIIERATPRLL